MGQRGSSPAMSASGDRVGALSPQHSLRLTDRSAACHGRDMVNAGTFSFDLRQFPKDDFSRFRNSVLNGRGQAMPAWRDKLSDDDVATLWAYVRSGGG